MPNKTFNARVQMKRDTSANWTSNNPVLLYGEIIIVDTDAGEVRFKVGNGTSTYTQLSYTDEAIISRMLSLSGGTMTGNINMNGNVVTGLGAPVNATDAVRQQDLEVLSDEIDGIIAGTSPITLPIASDVRLGGVKVGEGIEITEDGTISADDQLPAGGTTGQLLTKTAEGTAWQDAPSGLPDGGTTGQILTKGENGAEWGDKPVMYVHITKNDETYSSDKTIEELLNAYENGASIFAVADFDSDIPLMSLDVVVPSMISFSSYYYGTNFLVSVYENSVWFGRDSVGANRISFTPGTTGLTSDNVQDAIKEVNDKIPTDYVPTTRTINSKPLSSNITLTADDVGATELNGVTVTLTSSGWSSTTGGFQQVVSVTGVTTDPDQIIWVDVSQSGTDLAADKALSEAWGAGPGQLTPVQQSGSLKFLSVEKPTVNIPVNVVVSG